MGGSSAIVKRSLLSVADNKRLFLQQKYFERGESVGHLLATVVRSQQTLTQIARLLSEEGVVNVVNVLLGF